MAAPLLCVCFWICVFLPFAEICLVRVEQFGDHLALHAVPEWANKYVNYKGLKKMLKSIWADQDRLQVRAPKKGLIPIQPSSPKLAPKSHHKWDVLHLFDEDVRVFLNLNVGCLFLWAMCSSLDDPLSHRVRGLHLICQTRWIDLHSLANEHSFIMLLFYDCHSYPLKSSKRSVIATWALKPEPAYGACLR